MEQVPITEQTAIKYGFRKLSDVEYQLAIELNYPGRRDICISQLPQRWMCYYQVNGVAACETKYFEHELLELYKAITGKELK